MNRSHGVHGAVVFARAAALSTSMIATPPPPERLGIKLQSLSKLKGIPSPTQALKGDALSLWKVRLS